MTEMESLLAACSVWVDGKQGFDAQAACVLADWLEENGRAADAGLVRHLSQFDLGRGWRVNVNNRAAVTLVEEVAGAHPFGDIQLELSIARGCRLALIEVCDGPHVAAGFFACLPGPDVTEEVEGEWRGEAERLRHASPIQAHALDALAPAIRLAAIRYVLGYTADRLIATMAARPSGRG